MPLTFNLLQPSDNIFKEISVTLTPDKSSLSSFWQVLPEKDVFV